MDNWNNWNSLNQDSFETGVRCLARKFGIPEADIWDHMPEYVSEEPAETTETEESPNERPNERPDERAVEAEPTEG